MAKKIRSFSRFINGIADFNKEGVQDSFYFSRCVDHGSDPRKLTLQPKSIKETGSVVTDLILWGEQVTDGSSYFYGDGGTFYKRTVSSSWSALRTIANSHGNGLSYFAEDDYVYYAADKTIGRYGPLSLSPQFTDDFLGSAGGVRLNTYSVDFESSSSQYAYCADHAALSITGDLSIEAYIKPESLPTVGNSMVLVSKWDENSNKRSYKFDIYTVSGYFGDGSDGALTISSNTTDSPIDSACTGTVGSYSLSATNASFTSGQVILIHQSRGTGAGNYMRNKISGYTAGTITLENPLNATYSTGAQVLVLKQYTNVTVDSGKTWTAKAWNGTVGGILGFICSGTFTNNGTVTASAKGFRGGNSVKRTNSTGQCAYCGDEGLIC